MPLPIQQNLAQLNWTVRPIGEGGDLSHVPAGFPTNPIRANVPGCIHTDLIDAGLIRDPRVGDAETEIQWVSWTDWRYDAEFDADGALLEREEIDLLFEHLDTIAAVELNGVEVGRASSEFLPWRFSVLGVLAPGRNRIAVTFTSPLRYVKAEAARLGARPVNGDYPAYNMIRKCASNFDWDWGPRVATCGIAGEVRLEGWSYARIAQVSPRWDSEARCRVVVGVQLSGRGMHLPIEVCGSVLLASRGDQPTSRGLEPFLRSANQDVWALDIETSGTDPWSPAGYGSQNRLPLDVELRLRGRVLDRWQQLIARREARLDTPNGGCTLVVNGRSIYCRGANWIPEGLFPRDRTPERVRQRLEQLKAANMNMVRVWGGGRYEPDWFYDICDELGIMVWQDFMMACACYPEEEPIRSLIEAEAQHHVARLSRHPSVVLWCGGNECTWAHASWGFKEKLQPGQTWGEKYYNEVFPRLCAEIDIPYIPNSPFSLDRGRHPNDPTQGDTHTWEVWGDGYRTIVPRFCSEFGQQAPSNIAALKSAGLLGEGLLPPQLAARQRGPGGSKRWYDDPIAAWFRPPRDFNEWHYLAQLLQARSLSIGIEWQRANMPRCMGSLIWQLNDAWPGLSWSLIDSQGNPKPAYFAVQRAFQDRLLTIQPFDGEPWLVAVNDSSAEWTSEVHLRRVALNARSLAESRVPLRVGPRNVLRIVQLERVLGKPVNRAREFIVADADQSRASWFFLPDRGIEYPEPRFELAGRSTLTAHTMIRDARVTMLAASGEPCALGASQALLLPGESCDLLPLDVSPGPVATSGVKILCANYFGASTST